MPDISPVKENSERFLNRFHARNSPTGRGKGVG